MADCHSKVCAACAASKPAQCFRRDSRTADGLSKRCAACIPPSPKALSVCGACGAPKELGRDCAPCDRSRKAAYKVRHAEKVSAARSKYKKALHAGGAAERAERKRQRKIASDLKRIEARVAWKARNKGAVNANTAQRWAAKHRATPQWADKDVMMLFYIYGAALDMHVDHSVPLRSDFVCGLHCEANLTLLTPTQNIVKGNRHWPDMP